MPQVGCIPRLRPTIRKIQTMVRNEAYRDAERRIRGARRDGATQLDLRGIGLTEVPSAIANLTQLQFLNLSDNNLTQLPEAIATLTQLRLLYLSRNQLTVLPEAIATLTQLQVLNLSVNQLTVLPEEIAELTQLQRLYLSGNNLTQLPEAIATLSQLEWLELSRNNLTQLPEAIAGLTQLQELYLWRNNLTQLPSAIASLTQLQQLDLSDNKLRELPEALAQLTQLQRLYLRNNKLTGLPEALAQLTQLKELNLGGNQLTQLPDGLGELAELRQLDLNENDLTDLPASLGQLRLFTLELNDNPLNPELAAAYEQGTTAVLKYLQDRAEQEITLNEAKLVLVGEGETGKTSLLGALRGDEWVERRPTTHGVEVDIKSLAVTDADSDTEIALNGWDFGGQNIYRHTHQIFFTAPAIYLAVWNPRRGPEQCRVDEWIEMVKHRTYDESRPENKPRILVVATHGGPKQRLDHIDEQALRDEFGSLIVGFHHVDSKTEYRLDELKGAIGRTAADIPQVGRKVPAVWKRLLDALRDRSETDACIKYEEFQSLCVQQGIDLVAAKDYAAMLNELGHLIHYSTDSLLKDIVILKPEWLSKAIGFVLEDRQVKDYNKGLVEHDRLSELWDDPARGTDRYPQELHPLFIRLMERFDLSYPVQFADAGKPPTSLIAQLVPSSRPEGWELDWTLKPGDRERTEVCRILDAETGRTVEVEGLMYRLIVRLHRYSLGRENYDKSRHWKNGLLLDDDFNGRAFIEQIAGDIYITVRAAYPSGFLGYICMEVESLVRSFWQGLDPRFHLPCPTGKCKGLLEKNEIIEFKKEGMPKVRCRVCNKFHEIDKLMAVSEPKPQWQDALAELKQGQQQILNAFDAGFDSLGAELRSLMSLADEQYRALLTTLTDPAKDGPRLFSFEPVEPGFWNKPKWISQKFRITLWCEYSRLPLPTLNGEEDKRGARGVYEIELTREWIQRASPLLRVLSFTLKLALPIAIPSRKLATDEKEYKDIAEQLEFSTKAANSFLLGSEKIGDWLVDDDGAGFDQTRANARAAIKVEGAILRQLHILLQREDPSFGGLVRVQNKRREFFWVHPQFVDEY